MPHGYRGQNRKDSISIVMLWKGELPQYQFEIGMYKPSHIFRQASFIASDDAASQGWRAAWWRHLEDSEQPETTQDPERVVNAHSLCINANAISHLPTRE